MFHLALMREDHSIAYHQNKNLKYSCRTNQNQNPVVDYYNGVLVRSEADSNRCTRFCRPLPSHSAIRPLFPAYAPFLGQSRNPTRKTLMPNSGRIGSANIQTFLKSAKLRPNFALFPKNIYLYKIINDILRL